MVESKKNADQNQTKLKKKKKMLKQNAHLSYVKANNPPRNEWKYFRKQKKSS